MCLTPLQDISVSVYLTFTGLGETLSLPVGYVGGAGYGNPHFCGSFGYLKSIKILHYNPSYFLYLIRLKRHKK
jgi:hypothetical protein